jgi:hypothetical protein
MRYSTVNRHLAIAAYVLGLGSTIARAQPVSVTQPAASLGVRVVDAAGQPLADAEVLVAQLDVRLRTTVNGTVRLQVDAGSYVIGVRKIGYLPAGATLRASRDSTTYTVISLAVATTRLVPVVTNASRTGLSGFVTDTAFRPLDRVRVAVAGTGRTVRTDSTGRFHLAVRPGTYYLRIDRDSFAVQTVPVTVPRDSGREIAVWLVPEAKRDRGAAAVAAVRHFDLNQRLMWARPASSRFYTHADLVALGIRDMSSLMRRHAQGASTPSFCNITLMVGGPNGSAVSLSSVVTDDAEFVEVYFTAPAARGSTSINGNAMRFGTASTMIPVGGAPCGYVAITVWPRP